MKIKRSNQNLTLNVKFFVSKFSVCIHRYKMYFFKLHFLPVPGSFTCNNWIKGRARGYNTFSNSGHFLNIVRFLPLVLKTKFFFILRYIYNNLRFNRKGNNNSHPHIYIPKEMSETAPSGKVSKQKLSKK